MKVMMYRLRAAFTVLTILTFGSIAAYADEGKPI
jgi:hypothetical protein